MYDSAPYIPAPLTRPPVVGQVVCVLHSYTGSNYHDCEVGDTTVVSVSRTGSFRLACNLRFNADGSPQAYNKAMRVGEPRYRHNDERLDAAARAAAFAEFSAKQS